jgi:hypothetical protein
VAFRDELRAWFDAHDPGPEPEGDEDGYYAWRREFQRELASDGRAAVPVSRWERARLGRLGLA